MTLDGNALFRATALLSVGADGGGLRRRFAGAAAAAQVRHVAPRSEDAVDHVGDVVLYTSWHTCYTIRMQREITQRELRNESGAIMRALDAGESFVVTRNGVPVAEMTPARRPRFTSKADVLKAFANAPSIDAKRFFSDVDAILDQDPTPRG